MNNEDHKLNWQPLSMIPVMYGMTGEMLKNAEVQLTNLKRSPHLLDDLNIKNLITNCTKNQRGIPRYIEQCKRWKKEPLNGRQLAWTKTSKYTSEALKVTLSEIVALAKKFKPNTINKQLQKENAVTI